MVLKKLKLKNFRGYKDITINFDKDMNVIIGRNDVGKSTILEALEIFFNSDKIKIDVDDLCIYNNDNKFVSIICCFEIEDDKILVDSTNYTTCKDEFLLNQEDLLEIKKEWDCSKTKITSTCEKRYITCNYPTLYKTPLIQEKIQVLQKIYDKYKDDPIYVPEKRTISSELRKAIYAKELVGLIEKHLIDIDLTKNDTKDIWTSIEKQLPLYFLFESDRKNTDKDSEIQDPLKAITKTVVESMKDEIQQMQAEVKEKVEVIGRKTIKKLAELDENISKDIKPNITLKPIDSSFVFDLVSDNNIPLNKRGSGIRRLILLSYFRADAEDGLLPKDNRQMIYAIEEPETSQHPDFQRMILDTLLNLSHKSTHQIIITSHTPEIAKMVSSDQLIFIKKLGEFPYIEEDETNKILGISETLGILPYAKTKTVIYVEGPNDVNFIKNINQAIPELKNIIDLESSDIAIIPLQGGRIIDWVNKNYFDGTNINEIYITDSDDKKYIDLINKIEEEGEGNKYGWYTNLLEMENYIPVKLISDKFNINLSKYLDDWKTIDVPKILSGLCKQEITNQKERERVIKEIINGNITKKLTKDLLVENDVWEEIEGWFKKIDAINRGSYKRMTYTSDNQKALCGLQ